MNHPIHSSKRRSRTARSVALGLVTLIVGSAAALLAPAAATAAPVSAITGVQITNAPPLVTHEPYTVEATWAVDDSATAGDTFTLDFPNALTAYAANFELQDAAGAAVGTCVVSSSSFLCTLGDYVDTHSNVHGTLHFQARFTEVVEEEEVVFTADNDVKFSVPVPGGVGDGGGDVPQGPQKWGYVNNDGESMTWVLNVPGEYLAAAGGEPVTIVDTYDSALTFDPAASFARWTLDSEWADDVWHEVSEGTSAGTYSVVDDAAAHAFTITFNEPVTSNDRLYQFVTVMDFPADAKDGQSFGNSMSVAGRDVTARPVVYVSSGGDGTGDNAGGFDVTKSVTGTGAAKVAGAEYTVNYSYTVDGTATTGKLTLADGETDGLEDLPEGTVVTLSEVAATGTGVTYGTPVYTGTGVTDNGDGTAKFTITDDTIAIALKNPVTTNLGAFDVTKSVTGTGAAKVVGAEYTVNYSYTVDGTATTGTLTLADGETDGLADLPEGTVVTLSEVAATGTGVTYGTPVYTGTGVTDSGDGTAKFTITDDTIAIALKNPVTTVPPKPNTPNGSLAITGADSGPLLAVGAVILSAGLVLLIGRSLRRRS